MSAEAPADTVAVHETGTSRAFEVRVAVPPEAGLSRLGEVAGAWGAEWQAESMGGRLVLPVRAGARHGFVAGPVSVRAEPGGCHLRFDVEDSGYRVQYSAFFLLLLGGLGGLITVVAPFVPRLVPLLPVGVVLAIAAWFLIVTRLTNSGPEEFLGEIARTLRPSEE